LCSVSKTPETGVESSTGVLSDYFNTTSQPHVLITKEWIEQQVLKFFISANIPFRQADNEYFQELISKIQVNGSAVSLPSRKVIRARLTKEAKAAKADLKIILSQNSSKISLALDMWSTRNKFGFLGILEILVFYEISFS
jgi:S-adenosylmethionine:tRNA-ribosyltransferase-isomerase (queuine synthetase)